MVSLTPPQSINDGGVGMNRNRQGNAMAKTIWTSNLNTGIEAIDKQHRKIVDYINQLDDAISSGRKKELVAKVIDSLADYTYSHFKYEERLLEEVSYPFLKAHRNIHQIFIRRLGEYQVRFKRGEDISEELHMMMFNWLFGHIKHDDMDYVAAVGNLSLPDDAAEENRKGFFGKLFG
ncbi:MAG: bacteriohemerythrin [Nitrosomonadales bacterium]|nr:bacteriohemerythrin [Nitrosomonadales bacterium]